MSIIDGENELDGDDKHEEVSTKTYKVKTCMTFDCDPGKLICFINY